MKLLFITRTKDPAHPIAGFAASWVKEFSAQLSATGGRLDVMTWKGELPTGSLGPISRIRPSLMRRIYRIKLIRLIRFIVLIARSVPRADVIFVHQHPVYAVLAAPFAKIFRKRLYLWYVHKHVDFKLKIATAFCDGIFTASKESFRLKTKTPVYVVGHGIDTGIFRRKEESGLMRPWPDKFTILSIARISPVKGYEVLIEAVEKIVGAYGNTPVQLTIVGGLGLKEHEEYFERLKQSVKEKGLEGYVEWVGPKSHEDIVEEYRKADLFVSLSDTGSLDKAPLEAMACGVPVVTSNEAFQELLRPIGEHLYVRREPAAVATALKRIIAMPLEVRRQLGGKLRAAVVRDHDLKNLVTRVLGIMQETL